jgi:hypothetical protein
VALSAEILRASQSLLRVRLPLSTCCHCPTPGRAIATTPSPTQAFQQSRRLRPHAVVSSMPAGGASSRMGARSNSTPTGTGKFHFGAPLSVIGLLSTTTTSYMRRKHESAVSAAMVRMKAKNSKDVMNQMVWRRRRKHP